MQHFSSIFFFFSSHLISVLSCFGHCYKLLLYCRKKKKNIFVDSCMTSNKKFSVRFQPRSLLIYPLTFAIFIHKHWLQTMKQWPNISRSVQQQRTHTHTPLNWLRFFGLLFLFFFFFFFWWWCASFALSYWRLYTVEIKVILRNRFHWCHVMHIISYERVFISVFSLRERKSDRRRRRRNRNFLNKCWFFFGIQIVDLCWL